MKTSTLTLRGANLRKLVLAFSLSIFTFISAHSQFSLLLEGGVNYGQTRIFGIDDLQHENILGYYIAGIPKFKLTDRIIIGSEFQYSLEGYGFDSSETFFPQSGSTKLHYIRIIPELELQIISPLSVFLGFNYGFLGSEVIKDENGNVLTMSGLTKSTDIGLITGVNLNLGGFNIALKYNFGLRDINDITFTDIEGNELAELILKNRFLQIGVGYKFNAF